MGFILFYHNSHLSLKLSCIDVVPLLCSAFPPSCIDVEPLLCSAFPPNCLWCCTQDASSSCETTAVGRAWLSRGRTFEGQGSIGRYNGWSLTLLRRRCTFRAVQNKKTNMTLCTFKMTLILTSHVDILRRMTQSYTTVNGNTRSWRPWSLSTGHNTHVRHDLLWCPSDVENDTIGISPGSTYDILRILNIRLFCCRPKISFMTNISQVSKSTCGF